MGQWKTVQPDGVAIRIAKRYDPVKKRPDSAYYSVAYGLVKTRLISSKSRVKEEELEANSTNKKSWDWPLYSSYSDNLVSHYEILSSGVERKWKRSDFFDTDFVVVFFVTLNYNALETYLFVMKPWTSQLEVISSPQVNFRNRQN